MIYNYLKNMNNLNFSTKNNKINNNNYDLDKLDFDIFLDESSNNSSLNINDFNKNKKNDKYNFLEKELSKSQSNYLELDRNFSSFVNNIPYNEIMIKLNRDNNNIKKQREWDFRRRKSFESKIYSKK